MYLSIWTDISNWFVEFSEQVKEFFVDNSRNPVLWVGLVVLGLIIFEFTYKALSKD
jgi:hypothetical protein